MEILDLFNANILSPALTVILFGAGLFCHFKYRGVLISKIGHIFGSLFERSRKGKGNSPFKAVMLALAGTLGVGNITGVASAIAAGGAGAIFWMWISAVISASLKFSEVVLAVKYRRQMPDGTYRGGAVYYIKNGLRSPFLSVLFALLCIFTSFSLGNMIQIKAGAEAFEYTFGTKPIFIGIFLAFVCFLIIYGGVKSISDFTVRMIPLLSLLYCAVSLFIIFKNADRIGGVFREIFSGAFSFRAVSGGILGVITNKAMRYGVSRGIASNESGCGTAPYAHASADTSSPVKQGFWGVFEVFADTIIICSLTAFVILLSPYYKSGADGMSLAIMSYSEYLGSFAAYFMCFSILFYSLSSAVCWSYYGTESVLWLSKKKIYVKAYIFLYCAVIILGSVLSPEFIWTLSDISVGTMTVLNTVCLLLLSGEVKELALPYFNKVSSKKK